MSMGNFLRISNGMLPGERHFGGNSVVLGGILEFPIDFAKVVMEGWIIYENNTYNRNTK